ncbi:MAG TPA: PAS domain S-box protein [Syntrophales bacterium]|nr:PAS domain S-box protein [Syntrophales bacterium]
MKKDGSKKKHIDDLRKRAEKKISGSMDSAGQMSAPEIQKVIHELQVHQVELEMQNEALRKSQAETAESQQKYSDLYDFAPVGYFTFDKKGHITETNVTGASLLGAEKRSLANQPFQRFIAPEHLSIFQSHLQKVLEMRSKQICKLKLTGKDGTSFDALIDTIAVMDRKGKFVHCRSSVTEITRAEAALRDSEERYRHIVEDSVEFIVRADVDGIITFVNRALCHHLNMERKEFLGKKVMDFIPKEERKALSKFSSSITSQNPVAKIEQRVIMPTGDIRWQLWTVSAIYSRSGLFIEFQAVGHDMTDRKKAEQALAERTAKLEEINKELESFSYSIAHDLRAPLRAIDGYARMLLKKHGHEFDEDSTRKFNVIRSNTQMMGKLIEGILTLSRVGRTKMSVVNLEMEGIIKDVWKELETTNPERNMALTIQAMPSAYGDRILIKQVYANLLANAVKFTKYKNAALIQAGGYMDGDDHIYYIKDNGVGFDMAYYDKLFGIFQRLHNNPDFEGTGVGLAIIQRVIHMHGGKVWAEGKVDEGATFYFSLPLSLTHVR